MAILSRFSVALSDLAYAGIFYHLLLSGLAHIGVRKPCGALPAVLGLARPTAFQRGQWCRSLIVPVGAYERSAIAVASESLRCRNIVLAALRVSCHDVPAPTSNGVRYYVDISHTETRGVSHTPYARCR